MQRLLVAFWFLVLASGTRTAPQQGKIGKSENQTASVSLRSTYDRLVKAAAQVEKITGDASLLSKAKRSKATERALVSDPKTLMSDAEHLINKAYGVMGKKAPASQTKSADELKAAYHEVLAAAEGVELVRRNADSLAPEKLTAFAAQVKEDPDKIEADVKKLEDDMKEAEEDVETAEKGLKEAEAAEEKVDDKEATAEAEAANKAAKEALAESDHEQHGGHELVGEALGDKERQEKGAADKAEAAKEVEVAAAEHKEADAAHAEADKVDDAHEEKVDAAEEKLEKAEDDHHEAIDAHNEHPEAEDVEKPPKKSGASQLASFAVLLTLALFQ